MEHHQGIPEPLNSSLDATPQLSDHSELSTLYPTAHAQWEGDILTPEARDAKKKADREAIITSIRGQFLAIGLLLPIPFFTAAAIIAAILAVVTQENAELMVIPGIVGFILWLSVTFISLRTLFRIFYQHALKAGPFIVLQLSLLGISIQGLYLATFPLHELNPIKSILAVGIGMFVLSTVLSFVLLRIWVSPHLTGGAKLALVTFTAVVIVGATLAVSLL